MKNITNEDLKNAKKQIFLAEFEKHKTNYLTFKKAKFGDEKSKKICLASIAGIREILYELANNAKLNGFEDVSVKAGYVAVLADDLYKSLLNEVNQNGEFVNGFEIE